MFLEKFFTEPVREPAHEGKTDGKESKKASQERRQQRAKRTVDGNGNTGAETAMAEALMAATGTDTPEAVVKAIPTTEAKVAEPPERLPQDALNDDPPADSKTPVATDASTKPATPVTKKKVILKNPTPAGTEKPKRTETVPAAEGAPVARSLDSAEFKAVLANIQARRKAVMGLKEVVTPEFVEQLPEYTQLLRLLDKAESLLVDQWEPNTQVAIHLLEDAQDRIESHFNTIQEKVHERRGQFEKSFGEEGVQELLQASIGEVTAEVASEKPKKHGWWNRNEQDESKVSAAEETKEASTISPEPAQEGVPQLSPELQTRIDTMRAQMDRLRELTNNRRAVSEVSDVQAREQSENYKHAKDVIRNIKLRLTAIEKGAEGDVQLEEIAQLESGLAQALWDMRKDFPATEAARTWSETEQEAPTVQGELTAAEVYATIRGEVENVVTNTENLVASYPFLKEEPSYVVYQRQLEKLRLQIADDASIASHYSIVRASISSLERQYKALEAKAFELEEVAEVTTPDTPEVLQNKEVAHADADGLFAWGEKNEDKKAADAKKAQQIEQKLAALQLENKALGELPEYTAVTAKLDALKESIGTVSDEDLALMSEALLALQRASVTHKVEQLRKETAAQEALKTARQSNAELAEADPSGLFAYGEESAAQKERTKAAGVEKLVLTDDMRIEEGSSDTSTNESTTASAEEGEEVATETETETPTQTEAGGEDMPRLFGSIIPAAGADARFAARVFQRGLLLERGRLEGKGADPALLAKLDDVLRIVGYVPDSGLREEDVVALRQLVEEINMPESLRVRRYEKIDQMYEEVEKKVAERLSSLDTKTGQKGPQRKLGLSTLFGLLSKKKQS